MAKRTHASVTETPCTCGYLQSAADSPENPITFDAQTAEYQFRYLRSMLVIYHCPFCGGAAPESKRDLLFAQISETEIDRLAKLLRGVTTLAAAIEKFGNPDFDGISTSQIPEQGDEGSRIQRHRTIRFCNLSDVADVGIIERPDGEASWYLHGKYIGNNANEAHSPDVGR